MKNKIVGIGVVVFIFIILIIVISANHDSNHFNDVTEIYITITDRSYMNSTTTKSLVINNKEVIKELVKPFKKFELVQAANKNTLTNNYSVDYEVKMNNGYTLTFDSDWANFDHSCHATWNDTDLEQCAPKDFFLQIIEIIKANT